jgi:hypothetical protein
MTRARLDSSAGQNPLVTGAGCYLAGAAAGFGAGAGAGPG